GYQFTLCKIILKKSCTALFPYTTLFRSLPVPIAPVSVAIYGWEEACSYLNTHLRYRTAGLQPSANQWFHQAKLEIESVPVLCCRSEEHTSELQSPYDLVCRLLLEKKKYI